MKFPIFVTKKGCKFEYIYIYILSSKRKFLTHSKHSAKNQTFVETPLKTQMKPRWNPKWNFLFSWQERDANSNDIFFLFFVFCFFVFVMLGKWNETSMNWNETSLKTPNEIFVTRKKGWLTFFFVFLFFCFFVFCFCHLTHSAKNQNIRRNSFKKLKWNHVETPNEISYFREKKGLQIRMTFFFFWYLSLLARNVKIFNSFKTFGRKSYIRRNSLKKLKWNLVETPNEISYLPLHLKLRVKYFIHPCSLISLFFDHYGLLFVTKGPLICLKTKMVPS